MINHLVGTQEGLQMSREINGEHVPAADTLGQMGKWSSLNPITAVSFAKHLSGSMP